MLHKYAHNRETNNANGMKNEDTREILYFTKTWEKHGQWFCELKFETQREGREKTWKITVDNASFLEKLVVAFVAEA